MTQIALFGSAFNPPSLGHKSVLESLSHFDCVLLEPSYAHAWGKSMIDYATRCELLDAFIADIALPNVQRSEVEPLLSRDGAAVTTYALLKKLQQMHPAADITFVMGPDNLFNFAKFYCADEIVKRWKVMACPEKLSIRSTDIRHALQHGESVEELTTSSVAQYLIDRKLYTKI
ncbi:nicotinate-nicotinamide nucleotide adenylyltransferase [Vibrio sp. SM6]|uniref:nicotinate-nucleotide adenylyltransferase n=1 Tax=Vibrio agarilyticus TaxID=2726741 RepID=A0A7X8YFU4_9VIBR|nr:nicotinate-nicotinamide nucleotide adenylyltransferase [Vibrio agarilyticus]NLS11711.1 nicotinate-nicotinamide nucleotide adenylyltransferase [Vibrio agarilyticus]